jgi:hypothetical protein
MLKLTDPLLTRAESKAISVFRLTAVDALFRNCATLSLAAGATAEQVPRRGRGEAQHHKESYQRK